MKAYTSSFRMTYLWSLTIRELNVCPGLELTPDLQMTAGGGEGIPRAWGRSEGSRRGTRTTAQAGGKDSTFLAI